MNKRIFGLTLVFLFLLLQNGHSQLPLQPRHTLKVFPGLFWTSVGYEFCPTAHVGIFISIGGAFPAEGFSHLTLLDLRWYPMKEGGKRFGESNRGILPYIGLWGAKWRSRNGEEGNVLPKALMGPGLVAGFRLRLGKRPSIDLNAGAIPRSLIFAPKGDSVPKSFKFFPRISLTFGWTLGLRQYK